VPFKKMSDGDSPWSSDEEESLNSQSDVGIDRRSSSSSDDAEETHHDASSSKLYPDCPCSFAPLKKNVPRKILLLHQQLLDLSAIIIPLSINLTSQSRYQSIDPWTKAVARLKGLRIPDSGYLDDSQGSDWFASMAMGM
jgi:hypothetical protein